MAGVDPYSEGALSGLLRLPAGPSKGGCPRASSHTPRALPPHPWAPGPSNQIPTTHALASFWPSSGELTQSPCDWPMHPSRKLVKC